ncbi:MAG: Rpn family recombination-promoting nuclease/putative transposase [Oscillospiraceae bacterium]|nr:Rpn family recombination-promoting nuclease/putative transposase [Oscillospiraceae bacterium]
MTFVKYKHLLKRLVVSVLKITIDEIEEFVILNGEIIPETVDKKFCRLDIHLKVNGQYIDIEMQISDKGNFAERLLVYWSKVFSGALDSGEDYAVVPKAILISFIDFNLFECREYHSEFVCMEKHRYELLTDKMSIFVFELDKLPKEIDVSNMLELFLRVFKADTEEELEALEKLEVDEMKQMVNAYHDIVNSPDYAYLERRRLMDSMDENQAINNAVRKAEKRWEGERSDMQAEIARLREQLSSRT